MPTHTQPAQRLPQRGAFLAKYRISAREFSDSGLRWRDLEDIYQDYSTWCHLLAPHADCAAATLLLCPDVHASKRRIMKPPALIEKIIRKSIEGRSPWVTFSNYATEVPDFIGVRALYLFQEQWPSVDTFIRQKWPIKKTPKPLAYVQEDAPPKVLAALREKSCTITTGRFA